MKFKRLKDFYFTIILFCLTTIIIFNEPTKIYDYNFFLFLLIFWLVIYNLFQYIITIFKLSKQNNLSFFYIGHLIFYLTLLFIISYYLLVGHNIKYQISNFFLFVNLILFICLLIFFLIHKLYGVVKK